MKSSALKFLNERLPPRVGRPSYLLDSIAIPEYIKKFHSAVIKFHDLIFAVFKWSQKTSPVKLHFERISFSSTILFVAFGYHF